MNKIVISILIWLVCMPCMVAAETSKELEEAKEEAKLMVRTAINHAFLSKAEKEELLQLAESRMN